MLLVNASKNAVAYKKELQLARSQNVDVTNFENKFQETDLHTMKAKFDEARKKADVRYFREPRIIIRSSLVFGKVEEILIIPLEKWKSARDDGKYLFQ